MAHQRVGDSGRFASEPLLQPAAKSMPEDARTFVEKSLRQIEPAILQLHFAGLDYRNELTRFLAGRLPIFATQAFAQEIQIVRSPKDLAHRIEIIDQCTDNERI